MGKLITKKIKDLTDEEKDKYCEDHCEDICYKCPCAIDKYLCHCKFNSKDPEDLETEIKIWDDNAN